MFVKVLMYEDRTQNYAVSRGNRRTIKLTNGNSTTQTLAVSKIMQSRSSTCNGLLEPTCHWSM